MSIVMVGVRVWVCVDCGEVVASSPEVDPIKTDAFINTDELMSGALKHLRTFGHDHSTIREEKRLVFRVEDD